MTRLAIPPTIARTSDEIGFGAVEKIYRPYVLRHAVAAAGVLCIAGLAALAAVSATRYVWIIWLVFAVLLLGVFWGIGDAWRFSRRRYYLCEGGLLVAAGVTRLTRTIAWDQVAELWRYQTRVYSEHGPQSFHRCRMRLVDGTRVNLEKPPLAGGDQLSQTIEERVTAVMLPAALAALEAGERLPFGPLVATPAGLTTGQGVLAWADLHTARVNRLRIRLAPTGPGPSISVRVRTVPNALVLIGLVHRLAPHATIHFDRSV
ncbi:hypothetical protein E1258_17525 [Micromonospora sp. KC207]|uniref:DUF6585 family protein n=1 Tax=Micromonospora sp. KC207 TaxID=2530377 RepID=UPI001050CB7D|nr:DUF6585 family protein [Micromonospora sp. KC207]TDC59582.1 hypothetical protein E1258_17525 [Micromonospora sp. KC207]